MSFLDSYSAQIRSILRIVTGLLFFSVGLAKIVHFPSLPMFAKVVPFDGIGFFSRYAAFICSGEMAIAYFLAHWAIVTPAPHSFYPVINGGAAAILYCFVFLYLAAVGPGPWAINQK